MPFIVAAIDPNRALRCSRGPVGRLASLKTSPELNRLQAGRWLQHL